MTDPASFLLFLAVAAFAAADSAAFLQIMISQPLAAGWLGGLAGGNPAAGLAVGIALQGTWGRSVPVGGTVPPAAGPAVAAAGALAAGLPGDRRQAFLALEIPDAFSFALLVLVALAAAEAGRWLVTEKRRRRIAWAARAEETAEDGGRITGYVLAGLGQSLLLGALLGTAAYSIGALLLAAGSSLPRLDGSPLFLILVGLGVGQTWLLLSRRRGLYALAGAALLAILQCW
jgi:hypothetical protein